MRACKTDRNQAAIVAWLRNYGASVICLHAVGKGCPDLLVGYCGKNYLMEVKMPGGKLTKDQCVIHSTWQGSIGIVHTPSEAIQCLK